MTPPSNPSGARVVIHQPNFNPYLGVFAKYLWADQIIHLDTVQFVKGEFQNRNRICSHGRAAWLTVPVEQRLGQLIGEVRINPRVNWQRKHLAALEQAYSKTSEFETLWPEIVSLYEITPERLLDWNVRFLEWALGRLAPQVPTSLASDLEDTGSDRDRRLIGLLSQVGASQYLAGENGWRYMNREIWQESGIDVQFCFYDHPRYEQGGRVFISHCGILDLFFRYPVEACTSIILQGRRIRNWT